ncbi:hypothetical protein N2152v2_006375 [Parachlorella kessleri]
MDHEDQAPVHKLPLKQQFKLATRQKRHLDDHEAAAGVQSGPQQQGRLIADIERADNQEQLGKHVRVVESLPNNVYNPRKPRVGPQYQATLPPCQPLPKPRQQAQPQQAVKEQDQQ